MYFSVDPNNNQSVKSSIKAGLKKVSQAINLQRFLMAITTRKELFKGQHFELYDLGNGIALIRLLGFIKQDQATESITTINKSIAANHIKSLLVDQRKLKVLSQEVQHEFFGAISQNFRLGIKKIATLEPEDVFAKAGMNKVRHDVGVLGVTKTFDNEEKALNWLLSEA